jgi:hypothetical protein
MGNHLEKALVLFEQRRYEMAAESLLQELAASPDDPYPRAILALCRSDSELQKGALVASADRR